MGKERSGVSKGYVFDDLCLPGWRAENRRQRPGYRGNPLGERQSAPLYPLQELTEEPGHPVLRAAQKQLHEYFAGKRQRFDLKLDFTGTPFQK